MCFSCLAGAAFGPLPAEGPGPFPTESTPLPWPDGRAAGGRLTWTGVAGFVFEIEGVRIAFDPFVSRPSLAATLFKRATPDGALVAASFASLDAVFVGHTHFDHAMDVPAVAGVSPRAEVHGGRTSVETFRRLGVPEDRLHVANDGVPVEVGPFRVTPVASRHGKVPLAGWVDRIDLPTEGVPRTPFRWPRGEVFAWRVEAAGRVFHLQGSAGIDDAALERQPPGDVLVACLAARKGTPRFLERLAERLKPAILVPCHHDDFFRPLAEPPRAIATLRWARFLDEAGTLTRAHGTRLWLPVRGVASAW